jgi:hypothetical protein
MKVKTMLSAVALTALAGSANAAVLFTETFDSYAAGVADSAFVSAYTRYAASAGAPSATTTFVVSATGGLSGSQAVTNTTDGTLVRKDISLNLANALDSATVSLYFQYVTSINQVATPAIGFTNEPTGTFTTNGTPAPITDIGGRITGSGGINRLVLRSNNGTVATDTFDLAMVTTNWYKIEYNVVKSTTANQFTSTISLYNADNTGAVGSIVRSFSATTTNATAYADASLFAGVREVASIVNMDNFQLDYVSSIPEPSSCAALAGFSVLGLVALRRRRSAR